MSTIKPRCGDCRFYFQHDECRRFPPQVDRGSAIWPRPSSEEWCGEFAPTKAVIDKRIAKLEADDGGLRAAQGIAEKAYYDHADAMRKTQPGYMRSADYEERARQKLNELRAEMKRIDADRLKIAAELLSLRGAK